MNKQKSFYKIEDLIAHLKTGEPTLYHSSRTSTVIPFESIQLGLNSDTVLGDLSTLKGTLSFDQEMNLIVDGFVTWKEARAYCRSHGRDIMTAPTEELAGILSGIATSATGERSFGFRNLRSQIVSIDFLNYQGKRFTLSAYRPLEIPIDLQKYRDDFKKFSEFKNAPFPRLEMETDLMTGTEGQLGIIIKASLKTIPLDEETYLFFQLPKWEEDYRPHLELFSAVQNYRGIIRACEIIDSNSIKFLPKDKQVGQEQDIIFLEIAKNEFESIYENLISKLELITEENIFEMNSSKCRELRMSVPRAIFEENSRKGVKKKGTDVQVSAENFSKLFDIYREFAKLGIGYNLFGHFGDAHLHFNFMPTNDEVSLCDNKLETLYEEVFKLKGSPFAEHGIGLLKRKYIKNFYTETQIKVFKELKDNFDPKKQFFPEGFMSC